MILLFDIECIKKTKCGEGIMKNRPEYDKRIIGRNLRRCRIAKNLSVEDVREYLQLGSLQAIYKWEEGKCYPQADTFLALMQLYGIGVEELLYEENDINCKLFKCKMDIEIADKQ